MSEFCDGPHHDDGTQCGAHYKRFPCCLNAGHASFGQLHLGVDASGDIFEWGPR